MSVTQLKHLPADKQNRLDALMSQNNEGRLTQAEAQELRKLVGEAEDVAVENARGLAEQRQFTSASVRGETGD
jgi:hypothetical protein